MRNRINLLVLIVFIVFFGIFLAVKIFR